MENLDNKLKALAAMPVDGRLSACTDAILQGATARRGARRQRQQMLMASCAALVMGLSASLLGPSPAQAFVPLDGLRGTPALAPSHLLVR